MTHSRLPSLTALRAFDAAARHLSFARAADTLSVTPAALSLQIKNLEADLGTPLFHRLNRAVALTEAGHALAPGCRDGFEALALAWRQARRQVDSPVLSVTAGPAFTAKWLAPRLYDFARQHPEIELRLSASLRIMDLDRDGIDVAVRYGRDADPALHAEPLGPDAVLPVMRPDMAARIGDPAALATAPLVAESSLDFIEPRPDWAAWFTAAGVPADPTPAALFSQADHALDAALSGGGAALARVSLAGPLLASGQLVAPFEVALALPSQFRFICRTGERDRPAIAAFHDWLVAQIAATPDPLAGKTLVPFRAA